MQKPNYAALIRRIRKQKQILICVNNTSLDKKKRKMTHRGDSKTKRPKVSSYRCVVDSSPRPHKTHVVDASRGRTLCKILEGIFLIFMAFQEENLIHSSNKYGTRIMTTSV